IKTKKQTMTGSATTRQVPVNQSSSSGFIGRAILVLIISFIVYSLLSAYFPASTDSIAPDESGSLKEDQVSLVTSAVAFENDRLKVYRTESSSSGKIKKKSELIGEFSLAWSGEKLSVQSKSDQQPSSSRPTDARDLSITWSNGGSSLTVTTLPQSFINSRFLSCHRAVLTTAAKESASLCLELPAASVYGGGAAFDQRWPINSQSMPSQAYVSNDFAELTGAKRSDLWGGFVERLWLTSRGLLVHVDDATPLSVGQEADRRLCLTATPDDEAYLWRSNPRDYLNVTICAADSAKEAYLAAHSWLYTRPTSSPDRRMLREPIWCTWARHKTAVAQSDVESLANDVTRLGFPASQIEIDDRYTINYGDLAWDPIKFPNPAEMTAKLKYIGHRVTTWIVPFFNKNTSAYDEAAAAGYLLIERVNDNNNKSADILWWQGVGGQLDPTNPSAVSWFANRLVTFRQQFGIESFKFDAGEVYYLRGARTQAPLEAPMQFTTAYVQQVAAKFGGAVEVRAGYRTQSVPVATRMFDKDSHWGGRNGLRSIVPNALMLSMAGYHFVMPDMIGGNAYSEDSMEGARPERELYIRWMQLSSFLPIVQFSIAPWDYDQEVTDIALKTLKLRAEVYIPALEAALTQLFSTGEPVTRPLWWASDGTVDDVRLWTVDDQFLVGDSLLVAPVIRQSSVARDILLPSGRWKDGYSGRLVDGPLLLKDHPAKLDMVPHFIRV
ncbi:hypothetical protein BOX15_Mlig006082g2, partial [Macrostomum lignano]